MDLTAQQMIECRMFGLNRRWCSAANRSAIYQLPDRLTVSQGKRQLQKKFLSHKIGPWKSIEALVLETLKWVTWFNKSRLLEPIGNISPAEFEAIYGLGQEEIKKAA